MKGAGEGREVGWGRGIVDKGIVKKHGSRSGWGEEGIGEVGGDIGYVDM